MKAQAIRREGVHELNPVWPKLLRIINRENNGILDMACLRVDNWGWG